MQTISLSDIHYTIVSLGLVVCFALGMISGGQR